MYNIIYIKDLKLGGNFLVNGKDKNEEQNEHASNVRKTL